MRKEISIKCHKVNNPIQLNTRSVQMYTCRYLPMSCTITKTISVSVLKALCPVFKFKIINTGTTFHYLKYKNLKVRNQERIRRIRYIMQTQQKQTHSHSVYSVLGVNTVWEESYAYCKEHHWLHIWKYSVSVQGFTNTVSP